MIALNAMRVLTAAGRLAATSRLMLSLRTRDMTAVSGALVHPTAVASRVRHG